MNLDPLADLGSDFGLQPELGSLSFSWLIPLVHACGICFLLLKTCWRLVGDFARNGKIFMTFTFAFYTSPLGNILHVTPPLTPFSQTLPSLAWEILNTFYGLCLLRLVKMVFNYSPSLPFFHFSIVEDFSLFHQALKNFGELKGV